MRGFLTCFRFRSQLSDVWFTIHTALAQSLLTLVPEMVGTCRR